MAGDQQEMTVAGLRSLATTYQQRAADCQEVSTFLRQQNSSLFWQSDAASSFKQHMQDYLTVLARFHQHFTSLAQELNTRAQIIEESQRNPVVGSR
jgi:uncharacterized protein YukE